MPDLRTGHAGRAAGDGVPAAIDLTRRIAAGDRDAEDALIALFQSRVLVLLRARTRSADRAQDLAQETWIAVIDALRRGALKEPQKLPAYIAGIARNVANNYFRRTGREPFVPIPEGAEAPEPGKLSHPADVLAAARLEAALERLSADDRRILHLAFAEGRDSADVAREMTLSHEAVRQRKSRALRALAVLLSPSHS